MSIEPESSPLTSPPVVDRAAAPTKGALRATFRHGTIYTIGVILSRLIGFIMIPVYTRVLSTAEYGVLEILSTTTDLVGLIVGAGLSWAVMRYYFQYDTVEERRAVVSTAAMSLAALFVVASSVGVLASGRIAVWLLGDASWTHAVRLAFIGFFTASTVEVPLAYLRAQHRSVNVVGANLSRLLIGLASNLVLVVWLRWGVVGVLTSSLIASSSVGAWLLWTTLRETGLVFSRPILRTLVRYGAPLILWNIGSFVLHYSDRYFLRALTSLDTVGLYSLAYKLAMMLSMLVTTPFGQAWTPKALELERANGEAAYGTLREIAGYFALLVGVAALGLALFGEELVLLAAGPRYQAAVGPIPVIVLGMAFFGLRQVAELGAMLKERSSLVATSTGTAALVVTGLNLLLIPKYGAMGAAAATAAAFATEFSIMTTLSRRVHPIRFPIRSLLLPLGLGAAVVVVLRLTLPPGAPAPVRIAAKIVGMGAHAALLWALVLSPAQRMAVRQAVRDPRGTLRRVRGS